MELSRLLAERYSVRKFQDRPLSREDLSIILKAVLTTPTGCNYQPQRVYVAESPEALEKLNRLSKCIFGAKTVLIFTYDSSEDWKNPLEEGIHSGVQDVSIAACHAMLQAWELGIGNCWVNYFANSVLERELGLPETERAVLLMPIGYPAPDAAPLPLHSSSKSADDVVRYI